MKPRQTPIRRVSLKRAKQNREYTKLRREYLAEQPACRIHMADDRGFVRATEIHHRAGRIGKLLTDRSNFMPLCSECHRWIHDHPSEARAKGYLLT